jgi:hypothetical protein
VKLPARKRGAFVAKPSGTAPKPPAVAKLRYGEVNPSLPYGLSRGRLSPFYRAKPLAKASDVRGNGFLMVILAPLILEMDLRRRTQATLNQSAESAVQVKGLDIFLLLM